MIDFLHENKQYLEEDQLVPLIRIAYNVLPFNRFKYDLEIILEVLDCDLESIYTQAAAEIIVEEELPLQGGKEHVDRLLNFISIEYWRKTNSTLVKRYFLCDIADQISIGDFLYWGDSIWLMFRKERDTIEVKEREDLT